MIAERLAAIDERCSARLARAKPPRWFRVWMIWASRAGDGWLWGGVGLAVLSAGGPARLRTFGAAAIASIAGIGVFAWLKRRIGRRRPPHVHAWASIAAPDRFSFPSGHTIAAFAVAAAIAGVDGGRGVDLSLLFLASSVGLSRLALGLHYLSDVVAGAAIGAAIGIGAAALMSSFTG